MTSCDLDQTGRILGCLLENLARPPNLRRNHQQKAEKTVTVSAPGLDNKRTAQLLFTSIQVRILLG